VAGDSLLVVDSGLVSQGARSASLLGAEDVPSCGPRMQALKVVGRLSMCASTTVDAEGLGLIDAKPLTSGRTSSES